MSKRGNTYPLVFNILGQDLTEATEVILTIKPLNRPALHFDLEHMTLTSDGTDTTILVKLTEEQSLSMDTTQYSADVNWMMDGTRGGTKIATKAIDRTLYTQVIGGGTSVIDPNATEPDVTDLTSEEVRVVNAVSPHVTTEQVTGGVVITITDIDGTHTATVYNGAQGEPGDPTELIDDTAGQGNNDKTWSANKLSGMKSATDALESIAREKTDIDLLASARSTTNETYRGITFAWTGGTCHVSGTATAASFTDVVKITTGFPAGMKAGGKYRVVYTSTKVRLRVYPYVNGELGSTILGTNDGGLLEIPSNATGILVRLFVSNGAVVDEYVTPQLVAFPTPEKMANAHRLAFFGDSIMAGQDGNETGNVHTHFTIPTMVANRLGVACDNFGEGGMGYLATTTSPDNAYAKISTTDLAPYDVIVMCFGVNDGFHDIGAYNSADETTCLGQFNKIVNYIFTQKPAVQLIVIAPFNGCNAGSFPDYWYGTPGGDAHSRADLSNALKQACEYYNIPYIEQKNSPLNGYTLKKNILDENNKSLTYMGADGVHLSDAGYKAVGGWISGEIGRIIG